MVSTDHADGRSHGPVNAANPRPEFGPEHRGGRHAGCVTTAQKLTSRSLARRRRVVVERFGLIRPLAVVGPLLGRMLGEPCAIRSARSHVPRLRDERGRPRCRPGPRAVPEGVTRGFLAIRTPQGDRIGHGELTQRPRGDEVDSRLLLQFKDGSVHDETTTYSQRGVFRLEAYHLTQRGPLLPRCRRLPSIGRADAIRRRHGRRPARPRRRRAGVRDAAGSRQRLTLLLLKNLPRGERATAQLAAFTPKPRLLRMELHQEGEDRVVFAGDGKQAARQLSTSRSGA